MAEAGQESEDSPRVAGGGLAAPCTGGSAVRVAPLDPEQLQRVLERVTRAQPPAGAQLSAEPQPPPAEPQPPPFVLQDAARLLRDAAQQAALQRGPGAQAPRLLPPQQLEAICIKVTPGSTDGKQKPMLPLTTIQSRLSPLPGRLSSGASPQLPGAQTLLSTRPVQPCFSTGPHAPRQVLAQRPLPALQLLPTGRGQTLETQRDPPSAAHLPTITPFSSSSSADGLVPSAHIKHTEKPRKPLKVKTRSGRISRPPKHKAKDYKFIKTEDLADGHPSDSDDYSELSLEEEEEQRDKQGLFDLNCLLRPRTFKCQMCDKSYIGKGGLARHFKLNPGHGHLELETVLPGKAGGGMAQELEEGRTGGPTPFEELTPAFPSEEGAGAMRSSLQQCDPKDLVELPLRQLAQAVSVYEFLLMKVEKDFPAKPLFPAVYKEFEELHEMVESLCQDYLSSTSPRPLAPLQINNRKVAESLGITGELLRQSERHPDCTRQEGTGQEPEQAGPQKRGHQTAEQGLAAVKKTRRGPLAQDHTQPCAHGASGQKLSGSAPHINGSDSLHPEENAALPVSCAGWQLQVVADSETSTGCAGAPVECQCVGGPVLSPQLGDAGTLTQERVAAFPEESAQEPCSDLDKGASLQSGGVCGPLPQTGRSASVVAGNALGAQAFLACWPQGGIHTCKPELGPLLPTNGELRNPKGDLDSSQTGLEHIREALTLQRAPGSPGLRQGQEQMVTYPEGLLLSHPDPLLSEEEDTVISTQAEGPALLVGAP